MKLGIAYSFFQAQGSSLYINISGNLVVNSFRSKGVVRCASHQPQVPEGSKSSFTVAPHYRMGQKV